MTSVDQVAPKTLLIEKKLFTFASPPNEMVLDCGAILGPITLAYETVGDSQSPSGPMPFSFSMPFPAIPTWPGTCAKTTSGPAGGTTWSGRASPSTPTAIL